ncbi:MAG: hypothetical protein AB7R89_30300, partial [Dehalococcoidia bacterium]
SPEGNSHHRSGVAGDVSNRECSDDSSKAEDERGRRDARRRRDGGAFLGRGGAAYTQAKK